MVTRSESAAATRHALVQAATELLNEAGPDAVTLRAVGARAGVSRGAPYGHFDNKDHLLAQLSIQAWDDLADEVEQLRSLKAGSPAERLERAVLALIGLCRRQPYVYALMFSTPADTPQAIESSGRLHNAFLAAIADVVGDDDALRYGALLMASAHGIASLEHSGHLNEDKWQVKVGQIVQTLIDAVGLGADGASPPKRSTRRHAIGT